MARGRGAPLAPANPRGSSTDRSCRLVSASATSCAPRARTTSRAFASCRSSRRSRRRGAATCSNCSRAPTSSRSRNSEWAAIGMIRAARASAAVVTTGATGARGTTATATVAAVIAADAATIGASGRGPRRDDDAGWRRSRTIASTPTSPPLHARLPSCPSAPSRSDCVPVSSTSPTCSPRFLRSNARSPSSLSRAWQPSANVSAKTTLDRRPPANRRCPRRRC